MAAGYHAPSGQRTQRPCKAPCKARLTWDAGACYKGWGGIARRDVHHLMPMPRENRAEILDSEDTPEPLVQRAYRDIARIHGWLGETGYMARAIRKNPLPVRQILDVGCGTGLVLEDIGRRLGVEAVGVDVRPHPSIAAPVPIFQADAVSDSLPRADVAFCMHLVHHLSEEDSILLIQNVGRFCPRFIILDLVRHPLPLALFRMFVAPFICPIDVEDGKLSIRRAYTPAEMSGIATRALSGTGSRFRHSVAPLYTRQVIDISYSPSSQSQWAGR